MPQTTATTYATGHNVSASGTTWNNPPNAYTAPHDDTNFAHQTLTASATSTPEGQDLWLRNWNLLAEEGGPIPNHPGVVIIGFTGSIRWQVANSTGVLDDARGWLLTQWQSPYGTGLANSQIVGDNVAARASSAWTTTQIVWSGTIEDPQSTKPSGGKFITRAMLANSQFQLSLSQELFAGILGTTTGRVAWASVVVTYVTVLTGTGPVSGVGLTSGVRKVQVTRPVTLVGMGIASGDRDTQASRTGIFVSQSILSGVRRATLTKPVNTLVGTGSTSGRHQLQANRPGTIFGTGRLSGIRQVTLNRAIALLSTGILSGRRVAQASRSALLVSTGILSGVRRANLSRLGLIQGAGFLSSPRRAEIFKRAVIAGAGLISGIRKADARRTVQIVGAGVLSVARRVESSRLGTIFGTGLISGIRQAHTNRTSVLVGTAFVGGSMRAEAFRSGLLVGSPNKLKGWGRVYAFGISGTTFDEIGAVVIPGVTVSLFRADTEQKLATAVSDQNGFFTFTLTSDPYRYFLRGHLDDGMPAGDHLIDTTDQELESEVTLVQGPSQPSPD